MKEAIQGKKDAHKAICRICTDENERWYERMRNKARKAVSKAMKEKAGDGFTEFKDCLSGMYGLSKK